MDKFNIKPAPMISTELKKLIRPLIIVQQVIWFAITGSIVFYAVIAYILVGSGGTDDISRSRGLGTALYVAALAVAICSIFYRRYSMSDKSITKILSRNIDPARLAQNARTKSIDSVKLGQLESLTEFELKVFSLMYELQKITFISLFLNEIMVIIGFVLAFLSGDPANILPFAVISLVLSFWMFPRSGKLIERARYLYAT
ncbi:MAG: hypothetical protein RIG61_03170 [Deltaproteobacteria bacterium]